MKRVSALTLPATAAAMAAETATARKGHVSPACWQVKYELMCVCVSVRVRYRATRFRFAYAQCLPARRATQMRTLL